MGTLARDEISSRLTTVFRSVFDDDSMVLHDVSSADDIEEWDSLNQIRIILACEQVFQVKLNARKISTLQNVGQMIDYLYATLSGDAGG